MYQIYNLYYFRIPIAANSIESILCEAIKLEFSAYSTLGGNQNSRELNDAERAKLNELIVANKALLAPLDDDITNLVGEECRFKVILIQCLHIFTEYRI
jgi:nuclear receptor subfamily 1 group I